MKTEKNTAKTTVCTVAYQNFLVAFSSEVAATKQVSKQIDIIEKLYDNANEFYKALFAEGYAVPKQWKKSTKGVPFVASTASIKTKIPAVGRLVSALDMRKMRAKKLDEAKELLMDNGIDFKGWTKTKIHKEADKLSTEVDAVDTVDAVDAVDAVDTVDAVDAVDAVDTVASADRVDTVNIPPYDAVNLVDSLQGFLLAINAGEIDLTKEEAKSALKAAKVLIDLAQKS